MANNDLYISLDYETCVNKRADLLNTQIGSLNIIKHLQKIRQVNQEKNKLKFRLQMLFKELKEELKKIESFLPKEKLPRNLQIKRQKQKLTRDIFEEQEEEIEEKKQEREHKETISSIDHELLEIKEKLAKLNS